jgi:hypothetical protein
MLVRRADATLWFANETHPVLPRLPKKHPVLLLDVRRPLETKVVASWLETNEVETLHIASNIKSFDSVYAYLSGLFRAAGFSLFSDSQGKFATRMIACIDGDRVRAISAWPRLDCFVRMSNGWHKRNETIATAMQAVGRRADDPVVKSFLQGIPREAHEVLLGFPDGHRRFVRLFRMFEREVTDLLRGRAWMLVYMLCYRDCFSALARLDQAEMRELLSQKQRRIWEMYRVPGSESFVRTMRKIPPQSCSIPMFHAMRAVFASEAVTVELGHLPRINLGAAQAVVHRLATASLVREVSQQTSEDTVVHSRGSRVAQLLHDIVEEAVERRIEGELRPLHSMAQANALMNQILRIAPPVRQVSGWLETPMPVDPPSIPAVIQQLTSAEQLEVEGEAMEHCVSRYYSRLAARTSLIFRVLPGTLPDITRATLELVSGSPSESWTLRQLKAAHNEPVSERTKLLVSNWLRLVNANPQIPVTELKLACLAAIAPSGSGGHPENHVAVAKQSC